MLHSVRRSVLFLILATAGGSAQPEPGIPVDTGLFNIGAPSCLGVIHSGSDGIAEYLGRDGKPLARAGSWLGRESRYLLRPLTREESGIRLRSLHGPPLDPASIRIEPCPENLPAEAVRALTAAQDLRLARFMGEPVNTATVERFLLEAIESMPTAAPGLWRAVAHYEAGAFYRGRNQLEQAAFHYQSAREDFARVDDDAGVAAAINALGLVAWRQGRLTDAWSRFERALEIRSKRNDDFEIAVVANNLGLLLTQQGEHDSALDYYELALEIFQGPVDLRRRVEPDEVAERIGDFTGTADLSSALNTLNNIALLQRDIGRRDLAERYWRNYLSLEARVTRATAGAEARANLGRMLTRDGRLDEALQLLVEALNRFEAADSPRWIAVSSIALSRLYARFGDPETAIRYARKAAQSATGDALVTADGWLTLGILHRQSEKLDDSIKALTRAVELFKQTQSEAREHVARSELARTRFLQGDARAALAAQKQLHQELLESDAHRLAAVVLSRVGEIYLAMGRFDEARVALERALEGHRDTGDMFAEFETLERLSRLYDSRNAPHAMEANRRAMDLVERIRGRHLPPLREAEFLAATRSVFDRQVEALLDSDRHEQAWLVAETARARGLRELRQVQLRRRNDPRRQVLLDKRAELVSRIHRLRLSEAARSGKPDAAAEKILPVSRQLDRIESALRQLRDDESEAGPVADIRSMQRNLAAGELMLSYYLGTGKGAVWIVSADTVRVARLEGVERLDETVTDLLTRLRHPRQAIGRVDRRVRQLRALLLEPAREELAAAGKLHIQPDGILHSLPFALLLAGRQDTGIADPPLTVTLTAGVDSPDITEPDASESLLIMADPGWDADTATGSVFPSESLLGRLMRDHSLAGLPGTRREADAIAALARGSGSVQLRLGADATREFVTRGGLTAHDIVHLATHGLVDLQYPMLSSLLLAGENALGPAFLRPHEIVELELNARLVTLSGCETGHGRILAGEGALSLARPFLIAGAEQVLASLWKIDDHRTTTFMEKFYHYLLVKNEPAPQALSHAQDWMRRQPATSHPYYWAGFVLISAD